MVWRHRCTSRDGSGYDSRSPRSPGVTPSFRPILGQPGRPDGRRIARLQPYRKVAGTPLVFRMIFGHAANLRPGHLLSTPHQITVQTSGHLVAESILGMVGDQGLEPWTSPV